MSVVNSDQVSSKLFWLCPNCGEILQKSEETALFIGMLADVSGKGTCPGCNTSQSTKRIYAGDFDFVMGDDALRRLLTEERPFLAYDSSANRWSHHGVRLEMVADLPQSARTGIDIEKGRGIAPSRMRAIKLERAGWWRRPLSTLIALGMLGSSWFVFESSAQQGHTGVFAGGESGVLIQHEESGLGVILMPTLPEFARLCRMFSGERHELILDELQALERWRGLDPKLGQIAVAGRESYAETAQHSLGRVLLAATLAIGAFIYFGIGRKLSRRSPKAASSSSA